MHTHSPTKGSVSQVGVDRFPILLGQVLSYVSTLRRSYHEKNNSIPVKIVFADENNLYWYWFRLLFIVGSSIFFVAPRITAVTMVVINTYSRG